MKSNLVSRLSLFLLLIGSSHAFLAIGSVRHQSLLSMNQKLNDIDLMAIENVAELCLQAEDVLVDECDLEEHEALVNQLTDQRGMISDQLEYLDDLLARLKGENLKP